MNAITDALERIGCGVRVPAEPERPWTHLFALGPSWRAKLQLLCTRRFQVPLPSWKIICNPGWRSVIVDTPSALPSAPPKPRRAQAHDSPQTRPWSCLLGSQAPSASLSLQFAPIPYSPRTPWRQNSRPCTQQTRARGAKPAHSCRAHVYRVLRTSYVLGRGRSSAPGGLRHSGTLPKLTFSPAQSSLLSSFFRADLPWYPLTEELGRPCEPPLSLPGKLRGVRGERELHHRGRHGGPPALRQRLKRNTLRLRGREAYPPGHDRPLAAPRAHWRPLSQPAAPSLNLLSVWCCHGLAGVLGTN